MDVQGMDCVVTGAASGIGHEVARRLVADGASVTSLDRNPPVTEVKRHVEVDLGDPTSIDAAVADLEGDYDALFNVAGIPGTHAGELVFRVNFLGLRHLTETLVPRLRPGGSIVNVASIAGFGWPGRLAALTEVLATETFAEGLAWFDDHVPEGNAYNFSKEAVTVYSMAAALRLRARDLRINAVLPGAVETPILVDFEESMGKDTLGAVKELLGRHAGPGEIAPAAVFLASRDAGWITGSTVTADGGLMGAVSTGLIPAPTI